ncbi:ubiquinone/menaquinone biosynthesis methyltransferase [Nocardioides baekrokdamisoli]|uniref:Ubiquinone/menaquinone biosynthesis methyltransferase n=1 Tax=Nocardioides baekrokdamisoli TaxID=1804624 RepID=A0A3G9IPG1_9ACTN|nr:class I SAM-dependent methyltransferase [Nocardioides baekrokdamisoli]BBH17955.1 ubiquinone/menaquinone biosynthesis methyltransferase [Nocardioides baekrokdamisoli]
MAEASTNDAAFVGNIPLMYDDLLVPIFFEEPARSVAAVIAALEPVSILETAAGTGALTRELLSATPAHLTATDLNAPMIDAALRRTASERVTWDVADALDLRYPDASFDVVTCQFGAMFFPDRVRGYAEARRVLKPGGSFVFTVWDTIENNAISDVVTQALRLEAGEVELDFLVRTPYGHAQDDTLTSELIEAGFTDVALSRVDGVCITDARDGAIAVCEGTPLRGEIERHPTMTLGRAVGLAATALRDRFGDGVFHAPMRWVEIVAR